MKILIAVDMEGITGVTAWDQVTPGHAEYTRFRKLMTQDVNAAIRGAYEAGAAEVIVADGHWNGSNILIEELDPRAKLNSGSPSPFSMMEGIDETVNAVFFIGYHARNGSPYAILDHTWSSRTVANVWLNELLTGEYGLNAAVAGHFGAPIIMAVAIRLVSATRGLEVTLTSALPGVSVASLPVGGLSLFWLGLRQHEHRGINAFRGQPSRHGPP